MNPKLLEQYTEEVAQANWNLSTNVKDISPTAYSTATSKLEPAKKTAAER